MTEQKQEGVVELVGAGVPADQGLSSLGLVMQLAGNVLAAGVGMLLLDLLFDLRGSNDTLWWFLLLASCITRSMFHRSAGMQLLYGESSPATEGTNQRMAGIRRYIAVGLLQTLFVGALLVGTLHVPGTIVVGIVLGLAVWPVTLAILMALPRFSRFKHDLPLTEDKGFEGASILMTLLGLCGLIATGATLLFLLELPGNLLTRGAGVLLALALAMLCIRSYLHVQAGLSGLRETSVDRSVELANRYANFGVISSFCGGGAMLLFVMQIQMSVIGLAVICGICWMLMAWPLVIRRFFSDRQFADLLAGDGAPLHRRAPDAGLTSLGWFLLAFAAYSATCLLPQLFLGEGRTSHELQAILAIAGSGGARSIWFSVGLVVLQGWAGFELIRMSPQSRVVATVFGVVATGLTVYISWPMLDLFGHLRELDKGHIFQLLPLALALIIPVTTIVLVNRKIAPTARARFRQKPASPSPASPG